MSSIRTRLGLAVAIPSFLALLAIPVGAVTSGPQIVDPAGDAQEQPGVQRGCRRPHLGRVRLRGRRRHLRRHPEGGRRSVAAADGARRAADLLGVVQRNQAPLVASTFAAGPGGAALSANYSEPFAPARRRSTPGRTP